MEQSLHKKLPLKHISDAADDIVKYIHERKEGKSISLKTRWSKFNNLCMGGIEPNAIYTIAGMSGGGKSSFVNSLESDLFELNKDIDFVVLSFSLEMLSSKQVGRKLSYKLNKTVSELYSTSNVNDVRAKLSEEDFIKVKKEAEIIKKYPIYYVDVPGSIEEIKETIINFNENEGKNKWTIIILDHTLLVKNSGKSMEREVLSNLQYMFMEMKKYNKNTIIQISQLNRNIENPSRVGSPNLHFPMRSDLFGADSIYQASDYVMVIHIPEMLYINKYGPNFWDTEGLIYLHFLKNREGELKIIRFKNNLKFNRLDEYNPLDSNNI